MEYILCMNPWMVFALSMAPTQAQKQASVRPLPKPEIMLMTTRTGQGGWMARTT